MNIGVSLQQKEIWKRVPQKKKNHLLIFYGHRGIYEWDEFLKYPSNTK
jgi:hypothetical protein